jgi:hypothetical protein
MTDVRATGPTDESDRERARKRVEKRRGLQGGLIAYVLFNLFFVGVWAMTGGGYFWPAWIIGGWGVGMALGVWDYLRGPVTESDVEQELRRMGQ